MVRSRASVSIFVFHSNINILVIFLSMFTLIRYSKLLGNPLFLHVFVIIIGLYNLEIFTDIQKYI